MNHRALPTFFLVALSLIIGSASAWYIHMLALTTRFADQNAHLNLARLLWDSITPGLSQIGFWPPLLHVLMAPFTFSQTLYVSGLAGACVLVPMLSLTVWLFYKLVYRFTHSSTMSIASAVLLLLNPYVLYYSVTPMMEMLFVSMFLGATYTLFRWLETGKMRYLTLMSVFVALASLARFEGLILIPLAGLILVADLLRKKRSYAEIEATSIVYGVIALLGLASILIYGWVFGNDPLAFVNSDWSALSQQKDYFLPTAHNAYISFQYLVHASYYMIGEPQVWIGLGACVALLVIAPELEVIALVLMLLSPFIFDWLALHSGNIIVYVADLPPYGVFFNERYGLFGVVGALFFPVAILGFVNAKMRFLGWNRMALSVTVLGFLGLGILQGYFLYREAYKSKFVSISHLSYGYSSSDQKEIASFLSTQYDGGYIFITRALHDVIMVNANIPLHQYIHESNYPLYDEALEQPWLYARYVEMYHHTDKFGDFEWARRNERISAKWGDSEEFLRYYEPVKETYSEIVYKVKEDAVRDYAIEHDLDMTSIASLQYNTLP